MIDDINVNSDIVPNKHGARAPLVRPFAVRFAAFFLAVIVPGTLGPGIFGWTPGLVPSQDNTIILTIVALTIGMYFYRRVIKFPGVSSNIYIIPTFAIAYAVVVLMVLFARIDYSRFQLGMSFFLCVGWFYATHFLTRRAIRHHIGIIPGGRMEELNRFSSIRWTLLNDPRALPADLTCVVADLRTHFSDEWVKTLADFAVSGVPVYHVKQLRESLTGRVEIEHLSENNLGNLTPNHAYMQIKRAIDFLVAAIMLPIALPIILLISLAIKIIDGGPIFFTQKRVGYRGQDFKVFKFRTMRPPTAPEDTIQDAMTDTDDNRITPLGAKLRRTRLDELPQMFNILLGDMSWIGPRPEAKQLSEWYEKDLPFYRYRFVVRPGITGWAQVNQGHVTSIEKVNGKLQFDFYYIKNFSLWLDILIVFKTAHVVFSGAGAR